MILKENQEFTKAQIKFILMKSLLLIFKKKFRKKKASSTSLSPMHVTWSF